jgi:hypothetical protein
MTQGHKNKTILFYEKFDKFQKQGRPETPLVYKHKPGKLL